MESKQADRIADALEEMVFAGTFKDGQRLDETRLAKHFGVSRTPIREALQRLVSSRLARQMPRRGVFVVQPGTQQLNDMFETMAEIEGICGGLAAERATQEGLTELRALNVMCKHCIDVKDADRYTRYNEEFHHTIYSLSGNTFLEKEALRLYRRLKPFRRVQLRKDGRLAQSVSEHNAFLTAMAKGDAEGARDILRQHVGQQSEGFYTNMAQLNRAPSQHKPTG